MSERGMGGSPDAPEPSILNDLGDVFLAVNCYRLMPGPLLAAKCLYQLFRNNQLVMCALKCFPEQII